MLVHQYVKVQAQVTVTPIVKHGMPKVYCIDADIDPGRCDKDCPASNGDAKRPGKYTFCVEKTLCIEVPIFYDIDVDVDREGVKYCGDPEFGPCACQK